MIPHFCYRISSFYIQKSRRMTQVAWTGVMGRSPGAAGQFRNALSNGNSLYANDKNGLAHSLE